MLLPTVVPTVDRCFRDGEAQLTPAYSQLNAREGGHETGPIALRAASMRLTLSLTWMNDHMDIWEFPLGTGDPRIPSQPPRYLQGTLPKFERARACFWRREGNGIHCSFEVMISAIRGIDNSYDDAIEISSIFFICPMTMCHHG